MSELLLSFIMPTFNSSEYLAKTMDSLIASIGQHSSSVEIICVDDGSTDGSKKKITKWISVFESKGYILKYVFQRNLGLGGLSIRD